jgi:hypothetical protein
MLRVLLRHLEPEDLGVEPLRAVLIGHTEVDVPDLRQARHGALLSSVTMVVTMPTAPI